MRNMLQAWRKDNPPYKAAKNLAEWYLCSNILWKVQFVRDGTGYSAQKISKQSVEGAAWFLLPYSKIQEERNELKEEL